MMNGFTKNYVKVKTPYNPLMVNQIGHVKMIDLNPDGTMRVELIEQKLETQTWVN
jgi:threonylcarbamoyladenosine tRNA methylthiotransferase MtaB